MSDNERVRIGKGARTVTVGCKIPNGLILQLQVKRKRTENMAGGGTRDFEIFERVGEQVVIKGNRLPFGEVPEYQIIGQYGLTSGVDAAFFEQWMEQNKTHDAVVKGLIFAASNQADAIAIAKDNKARVSGLEPLNPAKHGVKQVTTADVDKVA